MAESVFLRLAWKTYGGERAARVTSSRMGFPAALTPTGDIAMAGRDVLVSGPKPPRFEYNTLAVPSATEGAPENEQPEPPSGDRGGRIGGDGTEGGSGGRSGGTGRQWLQA